MAFYLDWAELQVLRMSLALLEDQTFLGPKETTTQMWAWWQISQEGQSETINSSGRSNGSNSRSSSGGTSDNSNGNSSSSNNKSNGNSRTAMQWTLQRSSILVLPGILNKSWSPLQLLISPLMLLLRTMVANPFPQSHDNGHSAACHKQRKTSKMNTSWHNPNQSIPATPSIREVLDAVWWQNPTALYWDNQPLIELRHTAHLECVLRLITRTNYDQRYNSCR